MTEGEEIEVSEAWRKLRMARSKEEGRESSNVLQDRPGKRRKVRDRIRETDVMWGQKELSEVENEVVKWLHEEKQEDQVQDEKRCLRSRQQMLTTWTWLRLEAWSVVVDLARTVEKKNMDEEQE